LLDYSLERLDFDIALLEGWLSDFKCAVMMAVIHNLKLPAQKFIGIIDIPLIYLSQIDEGARHVHLYILNLSDHFDLSSFAVFYLQLDFQLD
jgi:hypothetical protein